MIDSSPAPPRAGARVLVTGAAGFIGSHVTDELLARGYDVVALDDLSGGFRENVHGAAHFVQGSILDVSLIERLFREHRFDFVFHLAAYAAEGLSHFIKRFNYETNLLGSVNLINASVNHGVRCFVFSSSVAVYGTTAPPLHEQMPLAPEDPYGIAKAAVEQELRISRHLFGLRSIVFRPHNVYGVRQNIGDRYRNVVGIFMNQILAGKPLTIFGDGSQTRSFTHVSEIAPLLAESIALPDAYDRTFNIGSDSRCSVSELAERVSRALGVPFRAEYLPTRPEAHDNLASHDKARQVFGPRAPVALDEGLQAMAAWVKSRGARPVGEAVCALEIERNLPPSWRGPAGSA